MKKLLIAISFLGLALVIGPVLAYLGGTLDKTSMSTVMLAGTVLWFVTVPFWMDREP